MNQIIEKLNNHASVTGWKINIHRKESYELFFVKEKLETLRRTDTCDKLVTVYVAHGEFLGDSQFYVYPSTTPEQLDILISEAIAKATLINNQPYPLPDGETGEYRVDSNFGEMSPQDLAAEIANTIFAANTVPNGSLNSVEIFINRHTDTVANSRGLHKTQTRFDAMVETIPTCTTETQSVELYHQYNFAQLDKEALTEEIRSKMEEVQARSLATTPEIKAGCPVILNAQELTELFHTLCYDLEFSGVYAHSNQYSKGDRLQKSIRGDALGITMAGQVPGSVRSSCFDSDGLSLGSLRLIEQGTVLNYYGSNRYGHYLGLIPTGNLRCVRVDAGSADESAFLQDNTLEVISMSGLQVDLSSDYVGGEIRLAYYRHNGRRIPVTGISISGSVQEVLESMRLSRKTLVFDGYAGPAKAMFDKFQIF